MCKMKSMITILLVTILSLTVCKAQNSSFIENIIKVPSSFTESSMNIGYANNLAPAINSRNKYLIITVFENVRKQKTHKYFVFDFKDRSIDDLHIDTLRYKPFAFINDTLFCESRTSKEFLAYDFYEDACKMITINTSDEYAILYKIKEQWIFNERLSCAYKKSRIKPTDLTYNQLLIQNRKLNIIDTINFNDPLMDNCYKCFWFEEKKLLISARYPDAHDFYSKLFIYDIDKKSLVPVVSNDRLYDIFDYKFNSLIACKPNADFCILKIYSKSGHYEIDNSSIKNIGKLKGDIVVFIDPNHLFSLSSYEDQAFLYERK